MSTLPPVPPLPPGGFHATQWLHKDAHAYNTKCYGGAEAYQACTEEPRCCVQQGFVCMKRNGASYSMCRPLGQFGECDTGDGNWLCPEDFISPPPPPGPPQRPKAPAKPAQPPRPPNLPVVKSACPDTGSGSYDPCATTGCCKTDNFGCYKRSQGSYAMCRPLGQECGPDKKFLCPVLPDLEAAAEEEELGSCEGGGGMYESCTEEPRCCKNTGFGCFQKVGTGYFTCRPMEKKIHDCEDTEDWICPRGAPRPPASPAHPKPKPLPKPQPNPSPPRIFRSESLLEVATKMMRTSGILQSDMEPAVFMGMLLAVMMCGIVGLAGCVATQIFDVACCSCRKRKSSQRQPSRAVVESVTSGATALRKKKKKKVTGDLAAHYWRHEDTSVLDDSGNEGYSSSTAQSKRANLSKIKGTKASKAASSAGHAIHPVVSTTLAPRTKAASSAGIASQQRAAPVLPVLPSPPKGQHELRPSEAGSHVDASKGNGSAAVPGGGVEEDVLLSKVLALLADAKAVEAQRDAA